MTEERLGSSLGTGDNIDKDKVIANLEKERDEAFGLLQEQKLNTDALLDGISLLYRLTVLPKPTENSQSMKNYASDVEVYRDPSQQQRFENKEEFFEYNDEVNSITKKIDHLCEDYPLNDTPFPRLLCAIQRLRSNLQHTSNEADFAESKIASFEEKIKAVTERKNEVEGALKKLFLRNISLKTKVRTLEKENEKLNKKFDEISDKARVRDITEHEMILNVNKKSHDHNLKVKRYDESDTYSTASSVTSCTSSVVTSTGISTLSFKNDPLFVSEDNWSMSWDSSPESVQQRKIFGQPFNKARNKYSITFEVKTKIGLHFFQMPVDRNGNIVDRGALSGMIITTELEDNDNSEENNFAKQAFLVCGYDDFDQTLNKRPSIGARLVSVNNESLERGEWTITKVIDRLKSEPPLVLTFQDSSLSTKQLSTLKNASRKLENAKKAKNEITNPTQILRDFSPSFTPKTYSPQKVEKKQETTSSFIEVQLLRDFSPSSTPKKHYSCRDSQNQTLVSPSSQLQVLRDFSPPSTPETSPISARSKTLEVKNRSPRSLVGRLLGKRVN